MGKEESTSLDKVMGYFKELKESGDSRMKDVTQEMFDKELLFLIVGDKISPSFPTKELNELFLKKLEEFGKTV